MFKRKSIRTKLFVALVMFSAIVIMLAVSSFWGLYGYQQTTNAILLRYDQQKEARKLQELADRLKDGNNWLIGLLEEQPMIGSLEESREARIQLAKNEFELDVESFDRTLERYELIVPEATGPSPLSRQERESQLSFDRVEDAFGPVSRLRTESQFGLLKNRWALIDRIELLNRRTDDLVSFLERDVKALMNELHRHYRTWTTVAWVCTLVAVAMVAVLLQWLNSLVVKPFRTLLDGSRLVAGGQFDHRIDLGSGDELSELAVAMNDMTDRFQGVLNQLNSVCSDLDQQVRERSREVIQNEQLASVGFLAAGVAHEINNPLATIAWSAESLESRVGEIAQLPSDQRTVDSELTQCLTENLRRIEEEAFRCKGITEKLLDFSRLGEVKRAPTNLVELVSDVVEMVSKVGKYRCKTIEVQGEDSVIAHVNPQEIRQVVLNLVTNALESLGADGEVRIRIHSDRVNAWITIEDNGCGMSDEVLKHLFEPFFTSRRDGTGTGLGLSITYRIVSQHGGSITAQSEGANRGSRMEILLPIEPASGNETSDSGQWGWSASTSQYRQASESPRPLALEHSNFDHSHGTDSKWGEA